MNPSEQPNFRSGQASTILVILVMAYLTTLALSNAVVIQTEFTGRTTRQYNKRAYFAAMAGVHWVISRLAQDPVNNTFDTANPPITRLFFARTDSDAATTYRQWTSDVLAHWAAFTRVKKGNDLHYATTAFVKNTSTIPSSYEFIVCSYPGEVATLTYFIKSQGNFIDPDTNEAIKAQVWARAEVDSVSKTITIRKTGVMPPQSLSTTAGAAVNDFWDWQNSF